MTETNELRYRPILDENNNPTGYFVDDTGTVYTSKSPRAQGIVPLSVFNSGGSRCVELQYNGKRKVQRVAYLVASVFLPEAPGGTKRVLHLNGDENDNRPTNLCWFVPSRCQPTKKETRWGTEREKVKLMSSAVPNSSDSETRKLIIQYFTAGYTRQQIADELCVSSQFVGRVIGKIIAHYDAEYAEALAAKEKLERLMLEAKNPKYSDAQRMTIMREIDLLTLALEGSIFDDIRELAREIIESANISV